MVFSDFLIRGQSLYEMNNNETQNYEPSHFCVNFACLGKPRCMK